MEVTKKMLNSMVAGPFFALLIDSSGFAAEPSCGAFFGLTNNKTAVVETFEQSSARQPFQPSDFPTSVMWVGSANTDYPKWASQITNQAVDSLALGKPPAEVLEAIRKARVEFQISIGSVPGQEEKDSLVGVDRLYSEIPYYSGVGYPTKKNQRRRGNHALAKMALSFHRHLKRLKGSVEVAYETIDRGTVPAGKIFRWFGQIAIEHPKGENTHIIYRDGLLRLKSVYADVDAADNFFIAMSAFYISMPLFRGGASIGRIFFSAIYYDRFGKKLKLPADVDVLAMIAPRQWFVSELINLNN